jgi:hypothetical protein
MQNHQPRSRSRPRTSVNTPNRDWRWIVVLLLLLGMFQRGPLLTMVLPAVGAHLAIRAGLIIWRGGTSGFGHPKETYWRGRRIDLTPHGQRITPSRSPSGRSHSWRLPSGWG